MSFLEKITFFFSDGRTHFFWQSVWQKINSRLKTTWTGDLKEFFKLGILFSQVHNFYTKPQKRNEDLMSKLFENAYFPQVVQEWFEGGSAFADRSSTICVPYTSEWRALWILLQPTTVRKNLIIISFIIL